MNLMDIEVDGKVVLAVGAHADDMDFSASGTVAKWVKEGAEVYYLVLTDGSKGYEDHNFASEKLIKTRREEQEKAAKILGVKKVFFGNFVDGELVNDLDVRRLIVKIIRQLKPDIVVTLDPTFVYDEGRGFINHPDHRAAGQATLDAVFPFARNSRTFPEFMEQGLPPHIVQEIFLVNFKNANFFVDIKDTFKLKLEAIKAHRSQYDDFDKLKKVLTERTKKVGQKSGFEYAESFIRVTITI